ncbi:DUF937 domain-containing protein [Streptomyces sp. NBC_01551]|uniref:DUF937 domain-containing protein n=1 Tax=Streptomyces sp. NBC_01551 TaxID=2975876 RepID=UPI00224D7446|nr:DUF937 domain-containing protein [Streptomyces sp. NBC_01551]MCX4525951.1 DUF937 domain-containing protein [Streptomyces sp. NBC_01551]
MSESSFQDDVLGELGPDRLTEIASLLGTDESGAKETVATTVGAMTGGLQQKADADDDDGNEVRQAFAEVAEPPLQGVATLGGGLLGGGLMAGVLAKVSKPVAAAVSKKTGIPAPTIARVIEMLIPVLLAVFAKRAAGAGNAGNVAGQGSPTASGTAPAGAAPGSAPAQGGGLGDLLGQILGGGKK